MADSVSKLHDRLVAGDGEAVGEVLGPLMARLTKLADRLLWGGRGGDADAEDAAQSAVRTYLRRASAGQFRAIDHSDELFRLLATITCRKALKQVRRRRKVIDESALAVSFEGETSRQTIEHLTAVLPQEEFDLVCQEWFGLLSDGSLRSVALMALYGYRQDEIAAAHGFTKRNVRYKLDRVRRIWRKTLATGDP
jgi:DNA-directed RNA polymerase specialized sigma24 family protein